MKYKIGYAVEPVYDKDTKKGIKLLYGYIVSKCYEIENSNGYTVLFPYALDKRTYLLPERRKPEDAVIGFNTNYVSKIYSNYLGAKEECTTLNMQDNLMISENNLILLEGLESLVLLNTKDMKISEKDSIKTKSLIR